jgi:hypothetical protein
VQQFNPYSKLGLIGDIIKSAPSFNNLKLKNNLKNISSSFSMAGAPGTNISSGFVNLFDKMKAT